jgi:hypothetical protein
MMENVQLELNVFQLLVGLVIVHVPKDIELYQTDHVKMLMNALRDIMLVHMEPNV